MFAQLIVGGEERGVHALLVPLRDEDGAVLPGVAIEDCGPKLGLDGVDNGRIAFDHVRVPREALLDRYAEVRADGSYFSPIENPTKRFFVMLGTLIQGRVSICGASITASKAALEPAVRHALTRRQFGPPGGDEVLLMDYRTHQRKLLPALATTYGLHFAQERLVARLHRVFTADDVADRERRELETLAAGLKAVASRHATDTIQTCREACGGAGYLRENRFAALRADTDVFTTFEGDNTVLLQLAAKNLLTGYRDQFGELDPLGLATFIAGQVIATIAERTAVRKVLAGELLDREVQLGLLRWRQEHILAGAARRLKRGIDAGREPFDVLLDCQDHVVSAARAWVELVVLEAFADAVARCEDTTLQPILDRLCSLYALTRIEAERGWYQEHGRLGATQSKAAIKTVNALCAELRPRRRDCSSPASASRSRSPLRPRSSARHDAPATRRAGAPGARRRAGAVRRARLRGGHDGRGRRARRRHQAAAVHVFRQQGAPVRRLHGARGRGPRRDRRGRRARRRRRRPRPCMPACTRSSRSSTPTAPRGASCSTPRSPRAPSPPDGRPSSAIACAASSPRRSSRGCRRSGAPARGPRSRRSPTPCSAPPRRSRGGGCGPGRCRPRTRRSCSYARSSRACAG